MLGKVFLNNFLAYEMYGSKNRTQVKISLQEKEASENGCFSLNNRPLRSELACG